MEHSRPLTKTDINRDSRLLFYFFIYANITIQQDNFKHIALFFNNISIIPPNFLSICYLTSTRATS